MSTSRASEIQVKADIKFVKEKSLVTLKKGKEKKNFNDREKIVDGFRYTWNVDLDTNNNQFEIIASENTSQSKIFSVRYIEPEKIIPTVNIFAIIVGISNYKQPKYNLKYAKNDAEHFYQFLKTTYDDKKLRNQISLFYDEKATKTDILKEIKNKAKLADERDLLLVYLACHGEVNESKKVYFYPYETDPDETDVTGIQGNEIMGYLEKSKANKKILIVDACHSGAIESGARAGLSQINEFILQLSNMEGFFILTSAGGSEKAEEGNQWGGGHGVFSYYLVKGLEGEADADKNKTVTMNELYEYVREKVKADTKNKQIPELKNPQNSDKDFPISIIK